MNCFQPVASRGATLRRPTHTLTGRPAPHAGALANCGQPRAPQRQMKWRRGVHFGGPTFSCLATEFICASSKCGGEIEMLRFATRTGQANRAGRKFPALNQASGTPCAPTGPPFAGASCSACPGLPTSPPRRSPPSRSSSSSADAN